MNFQIASDLHIDMKGGLSAPDYAYPTRNAPILILAGDVCSAADPDFQDILARVAEPFKLVFYIPGNHEYYGCNRSIQAVDSMIEKMCFEIGNVVYLNKRRVDIRGIAFIGATLWANCPNDDSLMNDFSQIDGGRFSPREEQRIHKEHKEWLNKAVKKARSDGCIGAVVMTHHAPTDELADLVKMRNRTAEYVPFYYARDLGADLVHNDFVQVWIHGHTHASYRAQIDDAGTIFASNALGYDNESTGYTERAVLRI